MGSIIRYTHRDCRFKLEFHEGVGFYLFKLQCEARENMRSGKWGEHWKDLMEQYPEGTATLQNALCYCQKCKKYFTEPRVKFYVPKDGFKYEYDERHSDMVPSYIISEHYQLLEKEQITCPDCEADAVVIENFRSIHCPVCGKDLKGRDVGNWD